MATKLTDLIGCGKPLVTYIEYTMVYWDRGIWGKHPVTGAYGYWNKTKELRTYRVAQKRSKVCGHYQKGLGMRVLLCDECLVRNGLKW